MNTMHIHAKLEADRDNELDAIYDTSKEMIDCTICGDQYWLKDPRWIEPHPIAGTQDWCCSYDCADRWCERYWEEIDEFEEGLLPENERKVPWTEPS